jgi:hypothetical protein
MRTVKWNAFLSGLCGFAAVLGVVAADARADVTIEKGASIVVFPKVLADGTRDTVIQLANTGNSMVHVKCYYVNASLFDTLTFAPCDVPSPTCAPLWQETDFNIWLTKQQPTHWLVSSGRRVDPTDGFGYNGSGFDPGLIPPVSDFEGELKCIEVTESDEPVTGNHLKGEATISVAREIAGLSDIFAGDVSKYNAIGILGNPGVAPSNPLLLNGEVYDACPSKLILNHFATLAEDPVVSELNDKLIYRRPSGLDNNFNVLDSTTFTQLTLVPCSEDFENQLPTSSTVQFVIYNEFEERFSASTTVNCYLNVELTDIDSPTTFERSVFSINVLGTPVAEAEITPVPSTAGVVRGVVGVAERFVVVEARDTMEYNLGYDFASAAYNLYTSGDLISDNPDSIRLTEHE